MERIPERDAVSMNYEGPDGRLDLAILERNRPRTQRLQTRTRPNPAPVDPDTRREIGPTVLPEERVRELSNPLFIQKLDIGRWQGQLDWGIACVWSFELCFSCGRAIFFSSGCDMSWVHHK